MSKQPKMTLIKVQGHWCFLFFLPFHSQPVLPQACSCELWDSQNLATLSSTVQVHGSMRTHQFCNWTCFFSTKLLSFNFIMQRRVKADSYRIKSHKSPHAWNHRRKGVVGPTSSLLFMLCPCHSISTSAALGVARGIPCVVCAPCAAVHFLLWCIMVLALVLALCHLPLASEENETEQVFTGGLQHLMGTDLITPKARDNNWDKNLFGWQKLFWAARGSSRLIWEQLYPVQTCGRYIICKKR